MSQASGSPASGRRDAERSRFLRRLDHELKNPLTGIKLALINLGATEEAEARQKLQDNIQMQVTRLSRIVTDLRKLADLGAQSLEQLPVDLTTRLQEVYALTLEETPANERDMRLTLPEPPQTLSKVVGDQDFLLVAFYNLLNNALKYTRPGDTVELRAYAEDAATVVEVRDTGIGIAPADLPYIWDELYRCNQVRDIPGSGIGLALVKLIIERHGGKIEVQSQLGQGTTVRVYLPTMPLAEPVPN